jgi:hypothetical protein
MFLGSNGNSVPKDQNVWEEHATSSSGSKSKTDKKAAEIDGS